MKPAKTILSLKNKDALNYFMEARNYCTFQMPIYYDFNYILNYVRKVIGDKSYKECLSGQSEPKDMKDVTLDILLNKDGKYAVRPLTLSNPYLYYFLSREICSKSNWSKIKKCFARYTVPNSFAAAIPVIPDKDEAFHNSTVVLSWWRNMQQKSIEYSLSYKYMFITDITNCYGSVNPQTIDWALSMKDTEYETNDNHLLAGEIIKYLQAMQEGRNIGIPQGSCLFDIISEIILGYADLLLYERIKSDESLTAEYKIIRYRDDYKIFCNAKDQLECMSYILQSVLEDLNFRMNSQKTRLTDDIIMNSVKPDKIYYIGNTPIFNNNINIFDGLEKELLFILQFSRKYPNSGQLKVLLNHVDKRIKDKKNICIEKCIQHNSKLEALWDDDEDSAKKTNKKEEYDSEENIFKELKKYIGKGCIAEDISVLVAIAAQIAVENVTAAHYALLVISDLLTTMKDKRKYNEIVEKVYTKLCNQPNSTYNQMWLQNITYNKDPQKKYDMPLCRLVMGNNVELWNNSWLKKDMTKDMPYDKVCNYKLLEATKSVIGMQGNLAYDEIDDDFVMSNM